MRDFDRRFNRMRRFVIGFIATVFVLILGYFIVVGIIAGKVISDPENAAEKVGNTAKKIKDGFDKGFKNDTVHFDTISPQ